MLCTAGFCTWVDALERQKLTIQPPYYNLDKYWDYMEVLIWCQYWRTFSMFGAVLRGMDFLLYSDSYLFLVRPLALFDLQKSPPFLYVRQAKCAHCDAPFIAIPMIWRSPCLRRMRWSKKASLWRILRNKSTRKGYSGAFHPRKQNDRRQESSAESLRPCARQDLLW